MRGKERCKVADAPKVRITPAYAGKSARTAEPEALGRDHPRLCGEKCMRYLHRTAMWGSPPPMRGKEPQSHI